MPRLQARNRAIRRLTKRICDLLFDPQYIHILLHLRKKLGINVEDLRKLADNLLQEHGFSQIYLFHYRNGALADHLLRHRLVGRSSYRALVKHKFIGDDGKFWEEMQVAAE